jgi:hypothetical protein
MNPHLPLLATAAGVSLWLLASMHGGARCLAEAALVAAVVYCCANVDSLNRNGLRHWDCQCIQ